MDAPDPEQLFTLLRDAEPFPDHTLPDTGIGPERERLYSSIFIPGGEYGTRSSTLVLIARDGRIDLHERSYGRDHEVLGTVSFSLSPSGAGSCS
jgi:uncharacterized protein with NRDE domain